MSVRQWIARVAGIALFATAAAQPASATVFLGAAQGAASTIVSDFGQGTPGQALITGPLGDYTINLAVSAVQPIVPAPIDIFLAASVTANAPGTLVLLASQTDVPMTEAAYLFSLITGGSSVAGSQFLYQAYFDPGNTPFAQTIPLLDTGFQPGNPGGTISQLSALFGPYPLVSFTEVFVLSSDIGDANFNAGVAALVLPEPAALAMFGPFVLLMGFARGRREVR